MIRLQGPCGGIGRRGRLKICYPKDVGVRVSPGAPPAVACRGIGMLTRCHVLPLWGQELISISPLS